jgi:hypothetical protein
VMAIVKSTATKSPQAVAREYPIPASKGHLGSSFSSSIDSARAMRIPPVGGMDGPDIKNWPWS